MYYEENSGMGFFDPISLIGAGLGLAAGVAPLFGKKDTSAEDAAKLQLKMTREAALAQAYQAERNKQIMGGVAMVGGAALLAGILIWSATRK